MLRDRNSIFFTGFVLGAIFSYSGMMGFLGGCITGAIVLKNFGKNFELNKQTQEWIEVENKIENGEIDVNNKKENIDVNIKKEINKNYINTFLEYFQTKGV